MHNPRANVLFGAIEGPLRKYCKNRNDEFKPTQTTSAGYAEIECIDDLTFSEQYISFIWICNKS